MREISFRGWQRELKKWIYGDLIHTDFGPFIFEWTGNFENRVQVDLDSVGQLTGLKDKNGTDLYEGDVVRWDDDGIAHNGPMIWDKHAYGFRIQMKIGYMPSFKLISEHVEIIGNIHEHKYLLSTFLFTVALHKRFNLSARIYRRARRIYALIRGLKDREINMDGTRVCFYIFFFAGPIVWLIVSLLTLLIP